MVFARRHLAAVGFAIGLATVALLAHDPLGFTGTILVVDKGAKQFTLQYKENGKDETIQIVLTSTTTVTRDKKKTSRNALAAGQRVKVQALGCEDEPPEAVLIEILPADTVRGAEPAEEPKPSGDAGTPANGFEIPAGDPVPTVSVALRRRAGEVWSFSVKTNLIPTAVFAPYTPLRGHLHVRVDGIEQQMVYRKDFEVKSLAPGKHTITVELSSTTHQTLLVKGRPVSATIDVTVPGR